MASDPTQPGDDPETDDDPLSKRLRAETADSHDAVEACLQFDLLTTSLPYYTDVLRMFYGFYSPLESEVADFCRNNHGCSSVSMRAQRLIRRDLLDLGVTDEEIHSLPTCRQLPALNTDADLWGCLYVIEGAKLGGVLIMRGVSRSLDITPRKGGRFFYGSGSRTSGLWQHFCDSLNIYAKAVSRSHHDRVIRSARETFSALQDWVMTCKPDQNAP